MVRLCLEPFAFTWFAADFHASLFSGRGRSSLRPKTAALHVSVSCGGQSSRDALTCSAKDALDSGPRSRQDFIRSLTFCAASQLLGGAPQEPKNERGTRAVLASSHAFRQSGEASTQELGLQDLRCRRSDAPRRTASSSSRKQMWGCHGSHRGSYNTAGALPG